MKPSLALVALALALAGCVTTENLGNGKIDIPNGPSIPIETALKAAALASGHGDDINRAAEVLSAFGVDATRYGIPGAVASDADEQTIVEQVEVRDADGNLVKLPLTETVTRTIVTRRNIPVSHSEALTTNAPAAPAPASDSDSSAPLLIKHDRYPNVLAFDVVCQLQNVRIEGGQLKWTVIPAPPWLPYKVSHWQAGCEVFLVRDRGDTKELYWADYTNPNQTSRPWHEAEYHANHDQGANLRSGETILVGICNGMRPRTGNQRSNLVPVTVP